MVNNIYEDGDKIVKNRRNIDGENERLSVEEEG
jgi:hypothetical protein